MPKTEKLINIVIFNKYYFFFNIFKFYFSFNINLYKLYSYNVSVYLYIFLCDEYFIYFKKVSTVKQLCIIKKQNFIYIINYIINIINFFKKYPYYYFNLKIFINIFSNLLIVLNKIVPFDSNILLNVTFIQITALGVWSFFTTAFIYKKYQIHKRNKHNFNNYFYWEHYFNQINWDGLMRHLKYQKYGGYNNYKKLKLWAHFNTNLHKTHELIYDTKLKKFLYKYNIYYNLLAKENDNDNENIIFKNVKKKKIFKNYKRDILSKIFLVDQIDDYTPLFNKDIPVPIIDTYGLTNKESINTLCHLISYDYFLTKLNINKNKSALSNLTEADFFQCYKNFYKLNINKTLSALNIEIDNPYAIPFIPYNVWKKEVAFDSFFIELDKYKDVNLYSLEELKKLIIHTFKLISEGEEIVCENVDYADSENILKDKLDYTYYKDNFQLFLWLNKRAVTDKNVIVFLDDFKKYCKDSKGIIDASIFDINWISDNDHFFNPTEMLDLFIHKNFFVLDYFNILINENVYSLCYLIFLYKVKKNVIDFEDYCIKFRNSTYNKYIDVVLDYNLNINNLINQLEHISILNFKYKLNSYLIYENTNSTDFLFSFKKKKINFKLLNSINIKNYRKNNCKKDFNNLVFHWEKFNNHFNKYFFNNKDKIQFEKFMSFEDFYYKYDKDAIKNLKNEIDSYRPFLIKFLSYYHFNETNKNPDYTLKNREDIGLYLFDIPGYEYTREDTELFFLLRKYDLLEFNIQKSPVTEVNNQAYLSVCTIYFHYVIKMFKNLKTEIVNIPNEHLLFKESDFNYSNFDTSMHGNREDFIAYLNHFLPVFKSLKLSKDDYNKNLLNYFMLHYKRMLDILNKYPLHILYDNNVHFTESDYIDWDTNFHDLYEIWNHFFIYIMETRDEFIGTIDILNYDKINEFLDYPMFQESVSFLLLKKHVFSTLKQTIIEERIYDHIYNITVCIFRIFEKHYKHLRHHVFISNGVLPFKRYLDYDDLQFVYSIESKNPLIFIQLYNSKQLHLNSELWDSKLDFITILHSIIDYDDRSFDEDDDHNTKLQNLIEETKDRDVIMYDVNINDITLLSNWLQDHNNTSFNQVNIEEELENIIKTNSLMYHEGTSIFKKISKTSKSSLNLDINLNNNKCKEKKVKESTIKDIIDDNFKYKKKHVKYVNNKCFEFFEFTIFDHILDNNNFIFDIMVNDYLIKQQKDVEKLPIKTNFKKLLCNLCGINTITVSDINNNSTELEISNFKKSVNYGNYLINFYNVVLKLNIFFKQEFEFKSGDINNIIINHSFNLLEQGNKDEISNNFGFNYLSLIFKKFNTENFNKSWQNAFNKSFNNNNLFFYYKGHDYLKYIEQIFNNNINLPNLTNYIFIENYYNNIDIKNKEFYDLTFNNTMNTLSSIFKFLNVNLLKLNYILKIIEYYNILLYDVYLEHCTSTTNNIQIFHKLKNELNKNKNNFMYIDLINILLYVKDPIYLFNILYIDFKLYLDNLLKISNIIKNPDLNTKIYAEVVKLSMLKKKEKKCFEPFYKGWEFDETFLGDKEQELYLNNKLSDFFNLENIHLLSDLVSNIILFQKNGFFNLSMFDTELDNTNIMLLNNNHNLSYVLKDDLNNKFFLEKINITNIFNKFKHINLFTIKNITNLELYDLNKLINYLDLFGNNNFESTIYSETEIVNYKDLLTYFNVQKERYRFLYDNNNINKNKENTNNVLKISKFNEFLGFDNKKKIIKKEKRFSSISSFYIREKKFKKIKIPKKNYFVFDEHGNRFHRGDFEGITHDQVSSVEDWTVTDSDSTSESEVELTQEQLDAIEEQRILAYNRVFKISPFVSNVIRQIKQWWSDVDFNKAYTQCKADFYLVLNKLDHPIWDDVRDQFITSTQFNRYITSLSEEDKQIMFDNYWSYTIDKILKDRELLKQQESKKRWVNVLSWSLNSKRISPMNPEELCKEFNLEMEYCKHWRRKWNERNFYILPKRKDSQFWTLQQWDEFYKNEEFKKCGRDQRIEYRPKKVNKKYKVWDSTNWWKLW